MSGPPGRRRLAVFLLTATAVLSVLTSAWAIGTPVFSAADEPAHVVKAAGVVRGQLVGEERPTPPGSYNAFLSYMTLPPYYAEAAAGPPCYRADRSSTAACLEERADDGAGPDVPVPTSAGRYGPLPYLVLGWPSLLLEGDTAVIGMRVAGALSASLLFAVGLTVLRAGAGGTRAAALGATAITPMSLAYAGAVNPSGLEISAAFAFATCLLSVARGALSGRRMAVALLLAAGSGALLVNVRPSSPLVVIVVGVAAVALLPLARLRELTALRATSVFVLVNVVAALLAATWTLVVRPLGSLGGTPVPDYQGAPVLAVRDSLFRTERYYREMIGVTGWLDTPVPLLALAVFTMLLSTAVVLGLTRSDRRGAGVLVAGLALLVVLPTALQTPDAAEMGLIFQGRYLLPFAVAVVVLATLLATTASPERRRPSGEGATPTSPGPVWVMAALLVAHVASLAWAIRRYAGGLPGPLGPEAEWAPPGGTTVLLAVTAAVGVLAVLLVRADQRRAADAPRRRRGDDGRTHGADHGEEHITSG